MTKYFERMNIVLRATPDATPDVVFEKLLQGYNHDANLIFKRRHHQFFIAKLLTLITTHRQQNHDNPLQNTIAELWKSIANYFNNNLPLHQLDKKGDFAQLLNSFLSFYPSLAELLNKDLSLHLSSSPYLFSTTTEINQLLNHLCLHIDENGMISKSFVNLILKVSPFFRANLFNSLPNVFRSNIPLLNRLQIAIALTQIEAMLPSTLIDQITNLLTIPRDMTIEEIQLLTSILARFSRHLNSSTQNKFIELYIRRVQSDSKDGLILMLTNLNVALKFLENEKVKPLVMPFLLLAKASEQQLSTAVCETLTFCSKAIPDFTAEKIKAFITNRTLYEKNLFELFDKLTLNYTEIHRIEAIEYLIDVYHKNLFMPPNSSWWYQQECRNKKACLLSIKKLYAPLAEVSKLELVENVIAQMCTGNVKPDLESYELLCDLIGERQFNSLQNLVNYFIHQVNIGESHISNTEHNLAKILTLAVNNKQDNIIRNFLGRLDPNNATLNHTIFNITKRFLYQHFDPTLKVLFFEKTHLLFISLQLPAQYELIDYLGWITEPEIVIKLAETIKLSFTFDLELVAKLTINGLTLLQQVFDSAQHTLVFNRLVNSYPKNNSFEFEEDYSKKLANYLYSSSLYARQLQEAARFRVLKKLIKEGLRTDGSRGFRLDAAYIKAVKSCVNTASEVELVNIIQLLMPLLLTEDEYTQNSNIPFEIIKALSSNAHETIAQALLTQSASNNNDNTQKQIFYLSIKLLEILSPDTDVYSHLMEKMLETTPRMKLKENHALAKTFKNLLTHFTPNDPQLITILYNVFIYQPEILGAHTREYLLIHVIDSEDDALIHAVIRKNLSNLNHLQSFNHAIQHLIPLISKLTNNHIQRIGEILEDYFNNDNTIELIERHPHDLDGNLLLGSPTLLVSRLLNLVPHRTLNIINNLLLRNSVGGFRLLQRLYQDHSRDFEVCTLENLKAWLLSSDSVIKSNSLIRVRKLLTVMDIHTPLVVNALEDIPEDLKQVIILEIASHMSNDTPQMEAFAKRALFDLFSLWSTTYKEMILNRLIAMVLKKNFVNTKTLTDSFLQLTRDICKLREAKFLKLIIRDAYSTKLMSSPRQHYDDARKLLLCMISSINYATSVRPWLQKKIQNSDITDHIMRFLI